MDQSQSSDSALAVISYSRHRGSERGRSFHIHLVNAPNQRTYLANQPSLKYLIFSPSLSPENIFFSLIQSSTPHLLLSTSPPLHLSTSPPLHLSSSPPLIVIAFWHLLPEAIHSSLLEKANAHLGVVFSRERNFTGTVLPVNSSVC
jgi:hypothetical protein